MVSNCVLFLLQHKNRYNLRRILTKTYVSANFVEFFPYILRCIINIRSHARELFIFMYYYNDSICSSQLSNRWLIRNTFFLVTDGDKDKEDIRRWTIGTDDAGGREKLLRAVRPGEYTYQMILINDGARKSRPYITAKLTVTNIRHQNRISPTVCRVSELARSRNHRACCLLGFLVTVQVDCQ